MAARSGVPPVFVALSPGDLAGDPAGDLGGSRVDAFTAQALSALDAGLPGLLLREPLLGDRALFSLAASLAQRARALDAWFCLHDRAHLAVAVEADALHLGFRSLEPEAARRLLPDSMGLGLSTHAGEAPRGLELCTYRVHGPVFDTPSKRGWKEPLGLEALGNAARASPIPLWAIGGLRPEHAGPILARGVRGLVARASVFSPGESPSLAARRVEAWLAALADAGGPSGVVRRG
ncbi:MAG: thiamine phosphate synthase [Planctomycetes bacterium]|nr:thiamine phosphate synthase [Planctomycetota bacterium]